MTGHNGQRYSRFLKSKSSKPSNFCRHSKNVVFQLITYFLRTVVGPVGRGSGFPLCHQSYMKMFSYQLDKSINFKETITKIFQYPITTQLLINILFREIRFLITLSRECHQLIDLKNQQFMITHQWFEMKPIVCSGQGKIGIEQTLVS